MTHTDMFEQAWVIRSTSFSPQGILPPTISMAHSFVIARLIPQFSSRRTSYYGVQTSSALVARPFLALQLLTTDLGWGDPTNPQQKILFIVSTEKPTGANHDCYFMVAPTASKETRHLYVHPPLTTGVQTLYIHTSPQLYETEIIDNSAKSDCPPIVSHQLDESSFNIFCSSVREDYN
jgi:hypothetical protein